MMNTKKWLQSKKVRNQLLLIFFVVSALVAMGYWIYSTYYISTDDAYINANVVQIAPRISGRVTQVFVTNHQHVSKGQRLFSVDPESFQIALNAANANVEIRTAELTRANNEANRIITLVSQKVSSIQSRDDAVALLKSAQAQLDLANANLQQAQLNLQYTTVTAPTSGWVENFNVREGEIVLMDQPLFALVDDNEFWADANFKETEMKNIRTGQKAVITSDLYPGIKFKAVVDSISASSGNAFSLLPPQNATGNWVKITQRVPVKVRILSPDPRYPLRVGTSAVVTIYLREFLNNTANA